MFIVPLCQRDGVPSTWLGLMLVAGGLSAARVQEHNGRVAGIWNNIEHLHGVLDGTSPSQQCEHVKEPPNMVLTTERLLLREFVAEDWPAILAYQSDPL